MKLLQKHLMGIALITVLLSLGAVCAVLVTKQLGRIKVDMGSYKVQSALIEQEQTLVTSAITVSSTNTETKKPVSDLDEWLSNVASTTQNFSKPIGISTEQPPRFLVDEAERESRTNILQVVAPGVAVMPADMSAYDSLTHGQISRVKAGESFTVTAGCMNMVHKSLYTLNKISIEKGHWKVFITRKQDSRIDIIYDPAGIEAPSESKSSVSVTPESFVLDDGGKSDANTSVLHDSFEIFIPVFISSEEVFFYNFRTAC